jgi:hypothetical protein
MGAAMIRRSFLLEKLLRLWKIEVIKFECDVDEKTEFATLNLTHILLSFQSTIYELVLSFIK